MTTSGQQTTATTGALDLTTKPRNAKVSEEDGVNPSESEKAPSRNGNCMDNGKVEKVEEMFVHSKGVPVHSNATKKAAMEMTLGTSASFTKSLSSPRRQCQLDSSSTTANCDSKTMDQSVSKLPFRKRPFPAGQEAYGPSRTPPAGKRPRSPENNEDSRCRPAKLSKHEGIGNRPQVQMQPVPMNGQGDRRPAMDPYQHMPAVPTYFPYSGYAVFPGFPSMVINVPITPLQFPHQEPDHLSIDAATRQDEDGDTALHIAVVQGHEALVHRLIHILLQAHKDLDIYNNLRQTPLHLAVITSQVTLVQKLLQAGSDPGALDRHGQTAAHLCCEHGLTACLEQVLSHPSPLPRLEARNYEGLTPLHLAVQNGNKKLVKLLLDSRADIDAVDIKSGRSPLIHAVENNNLEMINFLIENGCNVNAQSYSGNAALHSACGRGQVEVVRALLRNGADSSLKNYHNDTALMVAKNKKVTDVLRGKASRSQNPKPLDNSSEPPSPQRCTPQSQQHSANGTPVQSPSHTQHRSPLANHSASHSPSAPATHCPFTQSAESQSGEKEQQLQLVVVQPNLTGDHGHRMPFPIPVAPGPYQSSISDYHIGSIIPNYTPYQTPVFPRTIYLSPPFFPPSLPHPASHGPPFHHGQSRPSSHGSDQSDASTMSISSEGKGES